MRFVCTTAATNKSITFQNLLDSILVAATAIAGFDVFDQVRVNFVELWALPAIGASSQVSVQYSGQTPALLGDGSVHSDNSMGIEPAHVKAHPLLTSQASQWQISGAFTAFSLTCPVGSVVDVDLSFKTLSIVAPLAAQNALVAATIGDIVYRGLDGLAAAGTTLPAQAPITN
jgi:hypothetical protein